MAVALKTGVVDLLPELLAHAAGRVRPFQAAGAVASGLLQTFPYRLDQSSVRIQRYFGFQWIHHPFFYGPILPEEKDGVCNLITFLYFCPSGLQRNNTVQQSVPIIFRLKALDTPHFMSCL